MLPLIGSPCCCGRRKNIARPSKRLSLGQAYRRTLRVAPRRPDPAGRAFYVLLRCAAEGLSARRFAEYLSLGQVPDATPEGTPPEAAPRSERWVTPDQEFIAHSWRKSVTERGCTRARK